MRFNDQQQAAIETRGKGEKNILVSAGAGSGKTAVLAQRVMNIITDITNDTDIDNMLIMTFTQNAAAEMRERIAAKLKEQRDELMITAPASPEYRNIQRQLALLNKASICTIDSFCNTLVRQYFYKLDIDPAYRIAGGDDCPELKRLRSEILDEIYEEKLNNEDKDFIRLLEFFAPQSHEIKDLQTVIEIISRKLAAIPFPDRWLDEHLRIYEMQPSDQVNTGINSLIRDFIIGLCDPFRQQMEETMTQAEDLISRYREFFDSKEGQESKLNTYYTLMEALRPFFELTRDSEFDYGYIYSCLQVPIIPLNKGKKPAQARYREIKEFCEDNADFMTECSSCIRSVLLNVLTPPMDDQAKVDRENSHTAMALLKLYREYSQRYMQRKKEANAFSFSDINQFCISILYDPDGTPSDAAHTLREKYREVIVDEYQDNNYLQEYVLKAISQDNLFMVGDVKQSIYNFREACPQLFEDKYNTYTEYSSGKVPEDNICIKLNKNYRSRRSVLDLSNFLFYQLMSLDFGGIDYNVSAALEAGFDFPQPPEEIADKICSKNELLYYDLKAMKEKAAEEAASDEDTAEDAEEEKIDNDEMYANIIAQRISQLTDPSDPCYVYDKKEGKYRPCRLSDIAILMRKMASVGNTYVNVLGRYGIPAIIKNRYELFSTIEVKTVMALLKVIDNPNRDIDLITLLHSPVFNVSIEELTLIRYKNNAPADLNPDENDPLDSAIRHSTGMYHSVCLYLKYGTDTGIRAKLNRLMDMLDQARSLVRSLPFPEVLEGLYAITDYKNYVGMIKNGEQRLKNLRLLSDMADEVYASGIHDFGGIVRELCNIAGQSPSMELKTASDDGNAVNIMTIHASKGLEFPIVFVSAFNSSLKREGNSGSKGGYNPEKTFIIDADDGLAFDYFDRESRRLYPSVYKSIIEYSARRKKNTEFLRLLYVALTRAEEKLILVGHISSPSSIKNKTYKYRSYKGKGLHLPGYGVEDAGSFLEWLYMTYFRNDVFKAQMQEAGIEPIDINDVLDFIQVDTESILTEGFDISYRRQILERIDPDKHSREQEELDKKLLSVYMDQGAVTLPSKISISEIKRQHMIDEYARLEEKIFSEDVPSREHILEVTEVNKDRDTKIQFAEPEFISSQSTLSGMQRGTAYHTVFEHLKLKADSTREEIREQLEELRSRNILTEAACSSIDVEKFARFLHTDLGQRICASPRVFRETPFVMFLPPEEIYPDNRYSSTTGRVLVHGIIDLYFEEGDYIVLVDYKTDRVDSHNTPEMICQRYRIQLEYYKKAIERGCGKPVKEMYLYLVDADQPALVAKY